MGEKKLFKKSRKVTVAEEIPVGQEVRVKVWPTKKKGERKARSSKRASSTS